MTITIQISQSFIYTRLVFKFLFLDFAFEYEQQKCGAQKAKTAQNIAKLQKLFIREPVT